MARPKAFVTRLIPQAGITLLGEAFDVSVNREDRLLSRAQIITAAKGAEALVTLLTDPVDGALLDALPDLRIVANVAVGYDNIDVPEATKRGVWVSNTPDVLTETTADLAWALLLGAARRIGESERYLRGGKFKGWTMMTLLGGDVYGKTLGIAGFGRIGQAVARRARGFDMKIIYTDMARAPKEIEDRYSAKFVDKETLLRESDLISLHTPLTDTTRHFIGTPEFALMKKTAYLVNTSRGPIIDEAALAAALAHGQIAGAGLDVFEKEPEVNPALLKCENALIVPHIGSASIETRDRMATTAARNCIAVAKGERPPAAVNDPKARG